MGDGVEEISSGTGNGKVFVVDTVLPNNEVHPAEDMFIYVKFSAFPKSRVTYNGDSFSNFGVEDEVNFISTKIRYTPDGNLEPNPQKTYATTDWTEIGGFSNDNTTSAGVLEGFGIKSISIKYDASLVPRVDITFTDVRGSALFDTITNNDILSPYSVFFKMPYPLFQLSVKGYFGQKVDFCLHMLNWTSNFDGGTGNFDITANFVGYQQAFLNDMVLGNVIGAVNTEEGLRNLNNIFDNSENEELSSQKTLGIRKIDDFFVKIANITVESESIKLDSDNFSLLKFLNSKLNLLKNIQSFVGIPISKDINNQSKENDTQKEYLKIKNDKTQIETSNIDSLGVLNLSNNYWSIRDYLLINIVNLSDYKNYIIQLDDAMKTYQEYVASNEDVKQNAKNSLQKLKNKNSEKIKNIGSGISSVFNFLEKDTKENDFLKLFDLNNGTDNWKRYIIPAQKNDLTNNNFVLSNVLEEMYTENSSLGLYLKTNYQSDKSGVNSDFDVENFKSIVEDGSFYNGTMLNETKVIVVDFREIRASLQDQINDLESIVKNQKEIVQVESNDILFENFKNNNGFLPNIKNCFEIIANNTQAMIETIYDITKQSENTTTSGRKDILRRYKTDIPENLLKDNNSKSVAWPTIYKENGDGSIEETYIGEIIGASRTDFPEYDFVERVFENYIKRKSDLQQISVSNKSVIDTDNWFPINPIDYEQNPYLLYRSYNDEPTVKESFISTVFERVGILENYSLFNSKTGGSYANYGKFDALNAYETLKIDNRKLLLLKNILEQMGSGNFTTNDYITKSKFYRDNIINSGPGILPVFKNSKIRFGSYNLGESKTDPNIDYVLFDVNDIIVNSKKITTKIKETDEYNNITNTDTGNANDEQTTGSLYYKTFYNYNNLTTNNTINVWDKNVGKNIIKSNDDKFDTLSKTKISDINISGKTNQVGEYLNVTQFNPNKTPDEFESELVGGEFYNQQTKESKAYLLLSTFPFRNFKEGFLDSVFYSAPTYNGARIVQLPSLYVYFIGGLLWRYSQSTDPIKFTGKYSIFDTPKNEYLSKMTYLGYGSNVDKSKIKSFPVEESLLNLPVSVKNAFINEFKSFVSINFGTNENPGTFEVKMVNYTDESFGENTNKSGGNFILNKSKEIKNLILLKPDVFNPNLEENGKLSISVNTYNQYISTFKSVFDSLTSKDSNTGEKNTEEDKKKNQNNLIKLEIYNYFKNINNKWVSSTEKSFSVCGSDSKQKDLIKYFKFIDRGWRDIGSEVTINLKSLLNTSKDMKNSIYLMMSQILRDNNFLFQILPTYINYENATEISKIFRPQVNITDNNASGPIFCGIYVGGVSEYLDIKERDNYYFNNDGFSIKTGEIPSDMLDSNKASDSNQEDYSLVAFRVAFGAQNQTIFTDVSLSQQEHKETAEYFSVLSDTIDKRGATQPSYIGTNLLRLFKTRSYTCSVNALGCMNIQPLMYFDLQNVPFFNGAYLITSVDHSITPNHMTTSFKGLRQSKYQTKPSTDILTTQDLDLNATDSAPKIQFSNLNSNDLLYRIGIRDEVADQPFDFTQITQANLELIGVPTSVIESSGIINNFESTLKSNEIVSNSQVTMFLSNILAQSNNLKNNQINWSDGEYQKNEVKFITSTPFAGTTKRYGLSNEETIINIDLVVDGETTDINLSAIDDTNEITDTNLNEINQQLEEIETNFKNESLVKYFTVTPSFSAETQEGYNVDLAYYFKSGTDSSLSEWEKVTFEGNKVTTDLSTLTYYNIYKGDEYRYRPAGYLYMVGRKQYYDYYGENGLSTPQSYYNNNKLSLDVSVKVWKNAKEDGGTTGKTAFDYSSEKNETGNLGSNVMFLKTKEISQQYKGTKPDATLKTFRKVLETFVDKKDKLPLIDFFNP